MIQSLIQIAEKIVQLKKFRDEKESKKFSVFVSPILSDLEIIHQDYLKMFDACLTKIKDGEEVEEIIEWLRSERINKEPARKRVLISVDAYLFSEDAEPFRDFFVAVDNYFYLTNFKSGVRTASSMLIQKFEDYVYRTEISDNEEMNEWARNQLPKYISDSKRSLRNGWEGVVKNYAFLELDLNT